MAHLPDPGGFLDQDEGLMGDVTELMRMGALVDAQLEANALSPLSQEANETPDGG